MLVQIFGVQGLDAVGLGSELKSPCFRVRISLILKCRTETGRQGAFAECRDCSWPHVTSDIWSLGV